MMVSPTDSSFPTESVSAPQEAGSDLSILVSIIIPTFREAENIPILIPQVAQALKNAGLSGEIIIVDDNSGDGTESICQNLAAEYPVRLFVRTTERGLSSAVIHGMRSAR